VHWPTDVLAGWCVGSAWAILCWLVARGLQRKGQVEPDREQADRAEDAGGGSRP
jgi:undecaprenyl-diphosphatase